MDGTAYQIGLGIALYDIERYTNRHGKVTKLSIVDPQTEDKMETRYVANNGHFDKLIYHSGELYNKLEVSKGENKIIAEEIEERLTKALLLGKNQRELFEIGLIELIEQDKTIYLAIRDSSLFSSKGDYYFYQGLIMHLTEKIIY